MAKFRVFVTKLAFECFEVEADNYQDAKDIAIDKAYNYDDWENSEKDFEVSNWEEIE